ncbi:hypothetical protein KS419_02770, partial [Bacillus tamaricis]
CPVAIKKQLKKFKTTFSVPFICMAMAALVARMIGKKTLLSCFLKIATATLIAEGLKKWKSTTFSVPMRVGAGAGQLARRCKNLYFLIF